MDRADAKYAGIPELHGMSDDVRGPLFARGYRRSFRSPRVWLGLALLGFLCGLGQWIAHRLAGGDSWLDYVGIVVGAWLGVLVAWLIQLPVIRRWVRAELGTHCAGCDYDLRGSPERCPECGRVVSRVDAREEGEPQMDANGRE